MPFDASPLLDRSSTACDADVTWTLLAPFALPSQMGRSAVTTSVFLSPPAWFFQYPMVLVQPAPPLQSPVLMVTVADASRVSPPGGFGPLSHNCATLVYFTISPQTPSLMMSRT